MLSGIFKYLPRKLRSLLKKILSPLPEKPSIAVLPFRNLSGEPENEYFSDGMTEDLITDLSKISGLFVIGRYSTFAYTGKRIEIRQVAEDLGVRYVFCGSVRKAENTVRINVQLIDATTGRHLWAERYNAQMEDIFSLQDKITQKIVETLAVKLTIKEKEAIPKRKTDNLEAYLTVLKGWQHYRQFNTDAFLKAIPLFERATELEPNYWNAYAALATTYLEAYQRPTWLPRMELNRTDAISRTHKYLKMAMNGPTPLAHIVSAEIHMDVVNFQEFIDEAVMAVRLDPNDPDSHFTMGLALVHNGRHRESVDSFKRAIRLDPFYQDTYGFGLGMAYFFMSEFEKAADLFKRAYKTNPEDGYPLRYLISACAHLGHQREAEAAIAKVRELSPTWPNLYTLQLGFKFKEPKDFELLADGMHKAGVK
jgi:TolB-like protein/Flp pilus assembly protein TadD